jgi:hypothetical protein
VHAVVFGDLLPRRALQPVDARIAHMQHMHLAAFDDQGTEGADVAPVFVEARVAAHGLRMQPCIGGTQHPLGGAAHRPRIAGGVVVFQKTAHRGRAGLLADRAGANAIGQRHRNALAAAQGLVGQHGAMEVLVDAMHPAARVLAQRHAQRLCHGALGGIKVRSG